MRGSRRRFEHLLGLAKVSNPGFAPMNPYHMATRWMFPSGPKVAMFIVCRPWRKVSTSSSVMRIRSRREGMCVHSSRSNSGATGQSVRRSASSTDCGPSGPTTWSTRSRGSTSSSGSQGSSSSRCRPMASHTRAGQKSTHTGGEPHGNTGVTSDGGRRVRTGHDERVARSDRARLEQDEVARRDGGCRARRRNVDRVTVEMRETAGEPDPLTVHVDDENLEVAAPHECVAHQLGPANREHADAVGDRVRQLTRRAIGLDLVGRCPRLGHGVGRTEGSSAQPPQGPARRLPIEHPSAAR